MKKKILWGIGAGVFIIVFLCSLYVLVNLKTCQKEDLSKYKNEDSTANYETTADTLPSETTEQITDTEPVLPENPIDFVSLQQQNEEIYAWITVPGTQIDYPILQSSTDDSYYLRRDYLGNYSLPGCIFSQSLNHRNFSDPNTLLYGHYMQNGTFFGELHKFRDPAFFEENKLFYIYVPGHILTYEIFAAYEYDSRHILLSFNFSDKAVFEAYLDACKHPISMSQNVREETELNGDSRIVTLSTCLQSGDDDKRYLVQGTLINDEQTK